MTSTNFTIKVKKDELICCEGDLSKDLYKIMSGKLLICARNNHMVTPIAYLSEGQYFGEFSFFDNMARSADVIAVEDTELLKIPQAELKKQFPRWLILTAKNMTNKLRVMDEVISSHGIKKKNIVEMKALSIDEQRHYYDIISNSTSQV